jgi:hypothetical protein
MCVAVFRLFINRRQKMEIFGGLEGGLQISAPMPMHLAGSNPRTQHIILTQGDSVELAKRLYEMYKEHIGAGCENRTRLDGLEGR